MRPKWTLGSPGQRSQDSQQPEHPDVQVERHDPIPEHCTGDGLLIITADIGTTQIHRVYVDGGSSTEIMYEHCFEQLPAEEKKTIRPPTTQLVGFAGQ
ncbi:hypothetical protein Tco_1116219 [Tanacetum coccineum]